MPDVYDYDDGTNDVDVEVDSPQDSTFILDGLLDFALA